MANRARWMMKYEKGLVDILHENNNSHYRTQNGWRTEGWRKMVRDFNMRYPEAKFSKMQIQEHETQLKKDYKLIKLILQRDGVSWDQSASMIKATDEIWDDIIEDMPKARKYQSKSFPLLDSLELLFDGPIPEGGQSSPSSIPQNIVGNVDEGGNNMSTTPSMSGRPSGTINASFNEEWNNISLLQRTALGPQGIDDLDVLQNQHCTDRKRQRDEQAQSSSCGEPQRDRRKKRKVADIQQIMETYLNFRMRQARVKEQKVKEADQFTISNCIKAMNTMADVSDEIKVLASDVFKDAENREIFLSYESRLRALWLKREVGNNMSTTPSMSGRPSGTINASFDEEWNNISLLQRTALGPQGIDDLDVLQNQHCTDRKRQRDEQAQSSSCGEPQRDRRKKRKVADIQQIMETYLNFRMRQARVKEQKVKEADQFTISNCIKAMNTMADVSDEIKVLASDVFKDAENREIFLSYESRLRALWLKREVGKLLT